MNKPKEIHIFKKLSILSILSFIFTLIISTIFIIRPLALAQQITKKPKFVTKRETVYLIDTSASMGMDDPQKGYRNIFPQVKAWILGHIEAIPLDVEGKITIITFDKDVSKPFSKEIQNSKDKDEIRNKIISLDAKGKYTYTTKAILETMKILEYEAKEEKGIARKINIYLLSDGKLEPPCAPYITWDEVKAKYKDLQQIESFDFVWVLVPLDSKVTSPPGLEKEIPAKIVLRLTPDSIDFKEMTSQGAMAEIELELLTPTDKINEMKINVSPQFKMQTGIPSIKPSQFSLPSKTTITKKDLIFTITKLKEMKAGIYEGEIKFNSIDEDLILLPSSIKAKFTIASFSVTPQTADFGKLKKGESKTIEFLLKFEGLSSSKTISIISKTLPEDPFALDIVSKQIIVTPEKSQGVFKITGKALKSLSWSKEYSTQFILRAEKLTPITVPVVIRGSFPWGVLLRIIVILASLFLIIILYKKILSFIHQPPKRGNYIALDFKGVKESEDTKIIRIGRRRKGLRGKNDIALWHDTVSLDHIELVKEEKKEGTGYIIKVVEGRLNVNDKEIGEETYIKENDLIKIGDFIFEFLIKEGAPSFFVEDAPKRRNE